jgi:hypothetical protein
MDSLVPNGRKIVNVNTYQWLQPEELLTNPCDFVHKFRFQATGPQSFAPLL